MVRAVCPVLAAVSSVNAETFSELMVGRPAPVGAVGFFCSYIAHAALFFADEASAWITGQTLSVDGGHS
jgi:NAD(P)-dependent dehydrogenase (short-subunit alcohol dehydrogenase family)